VVYYLSTYKAGYTMLLALDSEGSHQTEASSTSKLR